MTFAVLLPAVAALMSAAATPSPRPPAPPVLRLRRTIPLPGNEGWQGLAVDPAGRRLYVTREDRVAVVDLGSETVVGEIRDTPGVHAVALAPEIKRGFTTDGDADTVTIFDTTTLATTAKVSVGRRPEAIVYDPSTKRVFAFGGDGQDVTAIEAAEGKPVGSLALGGRPGAAASDGKGRLFVNLADRNELLALDAATLAIVSRWPLGTCEAPTGLALDRARRRLFVGCQNRLLAVVDADSGSVGATLAIGRGADAIVVDESHGLVAAATSDGTLTVVREDKSGALAVVESTVTRPGSGNLALDPRTHRIYVPACSFGPPPDPTKELPHPPAPMLPGTFIILVFAG